jgi:4-amino-4-deoxy-L-arabinose transferase-like glycosyltransferase
VNQHLSFLDRIAGNQRNAFLFLFLLSLVFFVGLGHIHLLDWDEINFAESAREMIQSDNYLRVQINYEPFWEKPPFFFWLQVGAMKVFGVNEFAARFPNALFGFLYLVTFYLIGKRHYSAKFGLIWSLLFIGSILPHLYFKSGIIDPVFNFFIFLSIYFMLRVIAKDGNTIWKLAFFSGIFSGLSVITKGPVGFLLLGLTFTVYTLITRFKKFPSIKSILFFLIGLLTIVTCWLSMEVYQNGVDILIQFIEYQIELFKTPVAGHEQPFYYHFIVVALGCFPMSIFALPMFWSKGTEENELDLRKWMLVLFWVVMILFSITTTKIIHYSSMCYLPLSFLAALNIHRVLTKRKESQKGVRTSFLILGSIVGTLILVFSIIMMNKEILFNKIKDPFAVEGLANSIPWSGIEILIGILFIVGVIWTYLLLRKGKYEQGIIASTANVYVLLLLILFLVMPKVESITQSPAINFYKSLKEKDCYIHVIGFKSYAHYFYAEVPAGNPKESKDQTWLLNGPIDKDVYMVSKVNHDYLDTHPNFTRVKTVGGFKFYKRSL